MATATDGSITLLQEYGPLMKMQQQAAALRLELQMQGNGALPKVMHTPFKLSVHIPQQDGQKPSKVRVSTPGNPIFKPSRPYSSRNSPAADEDPFTPIGAKQKMWSRGPSLRNTSSVTRSARASATDTSIESGITPLPISNRGSIQGQRDVSPTSSITSRRSLSSPSRSFTGGPQSSWGTPGQASTHARATSALRASLAHQEANAALTARVHGLELELEHAQVTEAELRADFAAHQSSYMRREDDLQAEITKLKAELQVARGERNVTQDNKFGKASNTIQDLHGQVVQEIEALLSQQEVAIKHDEHTQTRRLKNRLAQIEAELGAERGAKTRTDADWLERTAALRQELDSMQDIATKLDAMYKLSEEECSRLRAQFKCQEDDRELLVRQVVFLKKENKRLAVELAAMAAEATAAAQQRDEALAAATNNLQQNTLQGLPAGTLQDAVQIKVQRYEDVIQSLQRLCEAERKRTKHARAAHTAELAARTELQTVLRQLLDDVRQKQQQAGQPTDDAGSLGAGTPRAGEERVNGHIPPRRPSSGRPPSGFRPSSAINSWNRPVSATCTHGVGAFASGAGIRRPVSASGSSRQNSQHQSDDTRGILASDPTQSGCKQSQRDQGAGLTEEGRAQLIAELQRQESLLLTLIDKAFPPASVQPLLPSDTAALDRLVGQREARDAAVVANAHALAAVQTKTNAGGFQAGKEALSKEIAGRPWVFNVDAQMSEFLQSGLS